MKKNQFIFLFTALFAGVAAFAGQAEMLSPRKSSRAGFTALTQNKRADVLKVVPHMAASDTWKSMLIIRNDHEFAITLGLDFYGSDGLPASAVFYDSDDTRFESDRFDLNLSAFEVYTIEFDSMTDPGLLNLAVYIFSDETESSYSVESSFSNFDATSKVATVGGGIQVPGANFFMNVDQRFDAYTNNGKLRGLAITNIETVSCDCTVVLWDELGGETDSVTLTLDPQEKWVGTVASLMGSVNLPKNLGLLDFSCTDSLNPAQEVYVSAVGLAFENGTPIVGSVPIEHYVFENGKKIRRGSR